MKNIQIIHRDPIGMEKSVARSVLYSEQVCTRFYNHRDALKANKIKELILRVSNFL